jgi:hypothetical protein
VSNQTTILASPTNQMLDIHSVQSTNPKGNQQPKGKRKGKVKKCKGDKKDMNNFGEGKNEKRKVNFTCNICMDDDLNNQFPQLEEAQNLLEQQHIVVVTNPFLLRTKHQYSIEKPQEKYST